MLFKNQAKCFYDDLVRWRRQFHANPELSFKEYATREATLAYLQEEHIEVLPVHSGNSIGGIIRGRRPGKTICLRADMDALPVKEANEVPYKSKNGGVMHACGHDVHMAVLMGALRLLNAHSDALAGNVKFIFQQAEEQHPGGAKALIDCGVLENPHVDAFYACHTGTYLESGTIGFHPGEYQAASDSFELIVKGRGGHGGYPHYTIDPIPAAAAVIQALQTIVSRNVPALDNAVVSVCKINAGTKSNVIPDEVRLAGTVRTLNEGVRSMIKEKMAYICQSVCAGFGCTCVLEYEEGYPVVRNDESMCALAMQAASKIVSKENVLAIPAVMGGEDTAYYLQRVPGVMSRLGAGNTAKGLNAPAHASTFDVDESCIAYGAEIMAQVAWDYLEENEKEHGETK